MSSGRLVLLVVDDERPVRDELAFLLERDERVASVLTCGSADEALRRLRETVVHGVLLDVQMPGLSGIELAGVLARFRQPPAVVFVTAHEEHAVDAFGLDAVDYVLKPVREERLREAVRRLDEQAAPAPGHPLDEQVSVELGGVTRLISLTDIAWVEAQGDYARLHVQSGGADPRSSHLLRTPLSSLEESWGSNGFVRIHRSLLVNLGHVGEVRTTDGHCSVLVGGTELGVSRRHTRRLRDLLAGTRP